MNKKPELENDFITFINSKVSQEELISAIKYLEKSNVLYIIESAFCRSILEQIEMFDKVDYRVICDNLEISNYSGEPKDGYLKEEFTDKVDEFIFKRKSVALEEMVKASSKEGMDGLNKKLTKLFFERYSRIIDIKEDKKTFELLENLDENNQIDISSAIEVVDNAIGGLKNGTITSIIGSSEEYKSLWAINIAYKALTQEKNVLYISLGCSKEDVYKRLLARHSCDVNKFDKNFNFEEVLSDYDRNNYNIIYNDFKNNHLHNIIIYDESEFVISTYYNLQKLIIKSQNVFREKTGNELDLIVIDDFSFMKLDSGYRCITNQNSVVNEYYSYLKDQALNLLGTGKRIPIVITLCPSQITIFRDTLEIYHAISNSVKMLSDNILVAFGNEVLKTQNKLEVHVLQSYCKKILKTSKNIDVKYKYWYIDFNKYSNISNDTRLLDLEEENQQLKEELKELKTDMQNVIINNNSSAIEALSEDLKVNFD